MGDVLKNALETNTQITQTEQLRTENVQFLDNNPGWHTEIASASDDMFSQDDMGDATLENFFARPIKQLTYSWTMNSTFNFQFDPWTDFFMNKRVMNRIANYNLLRATLHVKFVVNGTSSHYGKLLCSYWPLHVFDEANNVYNTNVKPQDMIFHSQRPNVIMDASGSASATLTLPFIHPANNLSIPAEEWQTMGRINLNSFTPVRHISGGTSPITVTVFIWATDVRLSMPTTVNPPSLTPQGGSDEYTGPISRRAAILEHMMGKLTTAPVVGKYAMATQTLAGGAASLASYFGYSRPTMHEHPPHSYVRSMPTLTNTNVHDPCVKLSLDTKQETTVDSRVVGLSGEDELTIASIATRQSYLTQFAWPQNNIGAQNNVLFSIKIAPTMYDTANFAIGTGVKGYFMTPLAFAALPFHLWRGSIKLRFMVAASAYHRGHLVIRYDPRTFVSDELNTAYTKVINIEETKDFTVTVGWGSSLGYLETHNFDPNRPLLFSTARQAYDALTNGVLEIGVVNPLSAPNTATTQDVRVLVFVSAGDDFEVAGPDDVNIGELTLSPQGGKVDVEVDVDQDHPIAATHDFTVASVGRHPELLSIHDGDPVVSFRQCLKRYNLHNVWSVNANDFGLFRLQVSDFPFYRGGHAHGVDSALVTIPGAPSATATPYNFCNTTLLNYLTTAYVVRRGGLRRMYVLPKSQYSYGGHVCVERHLRNIPFGKQFISLPSNNADANSHNALARLVLNYTPLSWKACAHTDSTEQNHIAVELPYHNNRRFAPARKLDFKTPSVGLTSHILIAMMRHDVSSRNVVYDYVSVAEDFNLALFLNAPVFFYNPKPPSAPV